MLFRNISGEQTLSFRFGVHDYYVLPGEAVLIPDDVAHLPAKRGMTLLQPDTLPSPTEIIHGSPIPSEPKASVKPSRKKKR